MGGIRLQVQTCVQQLQVLGGRPKSIENNISCIVWKPHKENSCQVCSGGVHSKPGRKRKRRSAQGTAIAVQGPSAAASDTESDKELACDDVHIPKVNNVSISDLNEYVSRIPECDRVTIVEELCNQIERPSLFMSSVSHDVKLLVEFISDQELA